MKGLLAALAAVALFATPAQADVPLDSLFTGSAGTDPSGGNELVGRSFGIRGVRNIHGDEHGLDIAAGNSDPRVGPIVTPPVTVAYDVGHRFMVYDGRGPTLGNRSLRITTSRYSTALWWDGRPKLWVNGSGVYVRTKHGARKIN